MTTAAAARAPAPGFVFLLTLVVAAWAALITTLAYRSSFVPPADKPQFAIIAAILLPPLLLFVLMRLSAAFRENILALDPVWICAMQGWRVVGSGFLFVHGFGYLPGSFAYQAGWGDVLVGVLAPFAVMRLARDPQFITARAYWLFNALGVADLILAPVAATFIRRGLSGPEAAQQVTPLAEMPLVFIVTFLVPFFLSLHLIGFAQIRAARTSS
ncbi:MAG: hypothetical protein A4S14_19325 [Proteobacteria bacterium SG_bin9]|nr:MAG: hypothetical protein A4S14_19325 [Proteobacteria bacterium SG_bin9]